MHFAHGNEAGKKVRLLFRIRLMYNSLVAFAGGAGLVRVYTGDEDEFFGNLFLYLGKTVEIRFVLRFRLFELGGNAFELGGF